MEEHNYLLPKRGPLPGKNGGCFENFSPSGVVIAITSLTFSCRPSSEGKISLPTHEFSFP